MQSKLIVLGSSIVLLFVLMFVSSCGRGEVSSSPVTTAPTKIGGYTITYLGLVNVNGNEREVIEVVNDKTQESTLMIRGFGTSDTYTTSNGKTKTTHND